MGGILWIRQDEIRKIYEGVVVDPPGQVLAPQGGVREALLRHRPPPGQQSLLLRRAAEFQFSNVVERVTDLMVYAQCDQDIRVQIGIHVSMKICTEFIIPGNIGLDQSLPGAKSIVLGLAHQSLGDRRNRRLPFNSSVGIYIGYLGVTQTQDIDGPIGIVDITGNLSTHHFETVSVKTDGKTAETRKVGDQIACRMVGRTQNVGQCIAFHIEVDNDVLFLIQIEMSEICHVLNLLKQLLLRVLAFDDYFCVCLFDHPIHRFFITFKHFCLGISAKVPVLHFIHPHGISADLRKPAVFLFFLTLGSPGGLPALMLQKNSCDNQSDHDTCGHKPCSF